MTRTIPLVMAILVAGACAGDPGSGNRAPLTAGTGVGEREPLLAFSGVPHDDSDPAYPPNDGTDGEIWVLYEDEALTNLTDNDEFEGDPSWSPDGRHIAYSCAPRAGFPGTYDVDICAMDLATGEVRRISSQPGAEGPATWSPDGKWIAFSSIRRKGVDVYKTKADGGPWVRITYEGPDAHSLAWSPDGKRFAFSSTDGHIYVMNSDGSDVRRLSSGPGDRDSPAWSPNGKWIAFTWQEPGEAGDTDIYKMRSDGSEIVRLTDLGLTPKFPAWSPDGQRIAFSYGGNFDIVAIDVDGGPLQQLTDGPREDLHVHWAPR